MFLIHESVLPNDATTFERVSPLKPRGGTLAGREDTMTLKTFSQGKDCMGTKQRPLNSLNTQDIAGAFVSPRWNRYVGNRPALDPIEGSSPCTHYPVIRRRPQNLSLTTRDIEYCQPMGRGFEMKTRRLLNPLAPSYSFSSSHAPAPPVCPHSGRDAAYSSSDIEFTSPSPRIPFRDHPPRDGPLKPNVPSARKHYELGFSPSLSARDVNYPDPKEKRPAASSGGPLDPSYRVPLAPGCTSVAHAWEEELRAELRTPRMELTAIGEVPGSKPAAGVSLRDNGEPQLSLFVGDVVGAAPQRYVGHCPWSGSGNSNGKPRFHEVHDIPGAQAGTVTRAAGLKRKSKAAG